MSVFSKSVLIVLVFSFCCTFAAFSPDKNPEQFTKFSPFEDVEYEYVIYSEPVDCRRDRLVGLAEFDEIMQEYPRVYSRGIIDHPKIEIFGRTCDKCPTEVLHTLWPTAETESFVMEEIVRSCGFQLYWE
ncbi:hypothetical protein PCE1_003928 [Barthelona sp. PCE]